MRKKIHAPQLHQWQNDFITLFDNDSDGRIFVIKSQRQVGKTFLMTMLLLRQSLNYGKSESWLIEPTLRQARKNFKDINDLLVNVPCIKRSNATDLIIEFANGSMICFGSGEQPVGLRGNTVKGNGVLIVDEAAFISNDVLYGVLFPFVNVHRRPIVLVSTPLFKNGAFYDLFTSDEKNISQFNVTDYDLSFFLSEEQKALYKRTMPLMQYLSEIEGQFIEEQSTVFGDFKAVLSNSFDQGDKQYYIGIDWANGANNDNTAIAIFNSKRQMVRLRYFNDKDSLQTIEEIAKIVKEYPPIKIVVEKNSLGKVFYDLLKKRLPNINITPFDTTNKTKNEIVNRLQVLIQNKEIQLLDDPQLKLDMVAYQIEETKTHKITYNAKSGSHDDTILATCFAIYGMEHANYSIR